MTGRHAAARRTRGGTWRPGVLALVGALGLMGGLGTQAYWNDQATVTGTAVTSGTLDLLVDGQQGNPSTYAWSSLSMTDMAPGESKAGTITLSNAGTTPFTVSATATASGNLDPHVTARVVLAGSATTDTTYPRQETCTGGTQTFNDTLGNTGKSVISSTSTMAAGASLVVCVSLTLATNAPNSMQGKSYTPVFTFTATQAAS
ncbi:TasA family protein [Nocardioides marinus]|uniref:Putative ribosomally synthesized peptide with SipW-like signal peptide n=1 Tax=Nocardioides marinus TaxID=374514 RepID=A0A7Y9YGK7_9ACTN|nr:TasA family protein [Nocardioides marinus]NYI11851.1 putative ribosomally synthesized peptide with SipW-like signal peptide [Nocardioides marinus]